MPQFALFAIEKAINFYLAMDPASAARLNNLTGQIILLQATDYNLQLYFLPDQSGLHLLKNTTELPTLIIRGKLFDILKSAAKDPVTERKANQQLLIEGDVDIAQDFRELLKNVNIDWEEYLSRYLGDAAAHQMRYQAAKIWGWGHKTAAQMKNNITEYLQYELSLLPARHELESFYADVHGLQEDVARLAAKIALLSAKLEKK